MNRSPIMTVIAVCAAAAFGTAHADSRNANGAQTRLLGENGIVRSALTQMGAQSADSGNALRERRENREQLNERNEDDLRARIADNREQRMEARTDGSSNALVGLEDTEAGTERGLTLGRLKVAVAGEANRAGEEGDDQPAAASSKVTVSTIPKEGEDSDVKGSSVATGLTLKGPSQESDDNPIDDDDDASRVGGSAETSLKLSTPKRDDNTETNSYGSSIKVGLKGVTTTPESE
ncbi:MAG: hypothetical protein M3O62_18255 [Pseudomonadota bacterium]|nr:hypothetical protein [Pseudomonadota bacterium]